MGEIYYLSNFEYKFTPFRVNFYIFNRAFPVIRNILCSEPATVKLARDGFQEIYALSKIVLILSTTRLILPLQNKGKCQFIPDLFPTIPFHEY